MTTIHHHQRLASSSSSSSSSSSLSSRRRRFAVKLRPVRIFRGGAYGVRNVEPWWNSWPESPRRMECSSHFCYAWTTQMACRTSHSPAWIPWSTWEHIAGHPCQSDKTPGRISLDALCFGRIDNNSSRSSQPKCIQTGTVGVETGRKGHFNTSTDWSIDILFIAKKPYDAGRTDAGPLRHRRCLIERDIHDIEDVHYADSDNSDWLFLQMPDEWLIRVRAILKYPDFRVICIVVISTRPGFRGFR